MKKLAIAATGALALAVGGVGISSAVSPNLSMDASISPTKHGTKKKPRNVRLTVKLHTAAGPSDGPFATSKTVVHLDKSLVFNGKALKTCSQALVQQDNTRCPKGSKVGTGFAHAVAAGAPEDLTVTAYNGPGGNKLELLVLGSTPLVVHGTIEGKLVKDKGKYGNKLLVNVPSNLQQPVQGLYATLQEFDTILKGTGKKKKPYIGLAACKHKKLNVAVDYVFSDGSKGHASTTAACK